MFNPPDELHIFFITQQPLHVLSDSIQSFIKRRSVLCPPALPLMVCCAMKASIMALEVEHSLK